MMDKRKNNAMLTPLGSERTTYKVGPAIATGFAIGTIFWICEMGGNALDMINLTQLMIRLAGLVGILILASMWFKWWMGSRWSNQHKFVKISLFLTNSCYGVVLSAIVFNIFVFIAFLFLRG
jgi:hypothetical protein